MGMSHYGIMGLAALTYKGDAVHNSDFRAYRDANKKGGDYLIFSDLERHAVDPPLTIKMGKR
jgi:hypothetical protein